jgi:hypothetical protein
MLTAAVSELWMAVVGHRRNVYEELAARVKSEKEKG